MTRRRTPDTIGHFPAADRACTGLPRLQYFRMRDFSMRVRVYIEDTDAGGVVFYANYLRYLERARTEALRAAGVDLVEWQRRHRRQFVVRSVRIDYLVPARLDDQLNVHARIRTVTRASLTMDQPIERGGTRIVDASVQLACVDADTLRVTRVPPAIVAALSCGGDDDRPEVPSVQSSSGATS